MKQQTQLRQRYLATLKHSDTEETIDLWFYRPVGFCVALLGEKLGWTPNLISTIGIFLGICSGILIYPESLPINLLGFAFLVMADVCDSADGQLARMTKQYSRIGRILDGVSSDLWFISIYVCIALRYSDVMGFKIWLLCSLAGASHAAQGCIADHLRVFHLYFVNGNGIKELDTIDDIKKEYAQLSFRKEPVHKLFIYFYMGYTLFQQSVNPKMTAFRKRVLWRRDLLMPEFCEVMRRLSFPSLKWTNALTYNWRAITLFVTILLGKPWLYPLVEVTLFNALLVFMVWSHEKIFREP